MTDETLHYWLGDHGSLSLALTLEDASSGSHSGDCEDDVRALRRFPHIARQLALWNPKAVRRELAEYGAWDDEELSDEDMSEVRLLWLACGSICDEALSADD